MDRPLSLRSPRLANRGLSLASRCLRREFRCTAEVTATSTVTASFAFGIRETVSLPTSPDFSIGRKPLNWIVGDSEWHPEPVSGSVSAPPSLKYCDSVDERVPATVVEEVTEPSALWKADGMPCRVLTMQQQVSSGKNRNSTLLKSARFFLSCLTVIYERLESAKGNWAAVFEQGRALLGDKDQWSPEEAKAMERLQTMSDRLWSVGSRLAELTEARERWGWMKRLVAEHPYVAGGAGFVAVVAALPALVLAAVVGVTLGIALMGFLFVEGTLLTIGTIVVGGFVVALGFILLSVAVCVTLAWLGLSNAYNMAVAVRGERPVARHNGVHVNGHPHRLQNGFLKKGGREVLEGASIAEKDL